MFAKHLAKTSTSYRTSCACSGIRTGRYGHACVREWHVPAAGRAAGRQAGKLIGRLLTVTATDKYKDHFIG